MVFASARCEAIAVRAADSRGVDPNRVVRVDVLQAPAAPAGNVGGAREVSVLLTLDDGSTRDAAISCGGIAGAFDPPCMAEPVVEVTFSGSDSGGYRDIPEGSTPFPAIDPAADAAARPLRIARQTIPINGPGPARILLGQVALANGVLQEVSISLADPWPDTVVLRSPLRMDIAPAGEAPIWNIYVHGWHEGTETVEAWLTFDAAIVRPGASLELVDVVVR